MAKGKSAYWRTTEGLALIGGWARDGLTEEDIANNIGISRSTLSEWKKKYPDISDTIKKDKQVADRVVENSLFKRATGYRYKEITKERIFNKTTGKTELAVVKEIEKEVPPETAAIIIWLTNRCPENWKNKQNISVDNLEKEQSKLAELLEIRRERRCSDTCPNEEGERESEV